MRISSDRLKSRMAAAGATAEQLGAAVERTGLKGPRAAAAVRNWMRGSDHPRCRPEDVRRMAEALGCEAKDLVRFECVARFVRSSPRKSDLALELIRGKRLDEAQNLLTFSPRRAAVLVKKALDSAAEQAQVEGADVGALVVRVARVDQGPIIKRFQPKDRGRAHPIQKITSHLVVAVEEAV